MTIAIPDATLGATFTNEITGITYTYDGQKWVAEGGEDVSHKHDEEYVNVEGDTMSGDLSIIAPRETREEPLLYLKPESGASPTQYLLQVGSTDGAKNNLVVQDNGEIWSRTDWTPSNDRHLTPKKYVDDAIDSASSLFRVVEADSTADLENGDIWFQAADRCYLSYKTLSGRIWATPVMSDNDLPWPQGIDVSSTASAGRNVSDIFFAYEDPELNRPMGMTPISQVSWPRWADSNGNPRGSSGKTHVVKFKYSTSWTSHRANPPVGTILRVRFAPWL